MESEFLSKDLTLVDIQKTPHPGDTAVKEQQFLRFRLWPDTTALLPVHQLTEVLSISPNQIVPIPHMPAWIMGVYNWRGEILWIADLGHLVGLLPIYQQTFRGGIDMIREESNSLTDSTQLTYTTIVIHSGSQGYEKQRLGSQITEKKILGLVVTQVEDMEWCELNLIQSVLPTSINPELEPFSRGYWLKPNGEILVVLDSESILTAMPKSRVV